MIGSEKPMPLHQYGDHYCDRDRTMVIRMMFKVYTALSQIRNLEKPYVVIILNKSLLSSIYLQSLHQLAQGKALKQAHQIFVHLQLQNRKLPNSKYFETSRYRPAQDSYLDRNNHLTKRTLQIFCQFLACFLNPLFLPLGQCGRLLLF